MSGRRGAVLDCEHQKVAPGHAAGIKQCPRTNGLVLVNGIAKFPVWMDVTDRDSTKHLATGPDIMQLPAINIEPVLLCHSDNMPGLLSDSDDASSDSGSSDNHSKEFCDEDASVDLLESDSVDSSDCGSSDSFNDFIDKTEPALLLMQEKILMHWFPITFKKNIDNGV